MIHVHTIIQCRCPGLSKVCPSVELWYFVQFVTYDVRLATKWSQKAGLAQCVPTADFVTYFVC